MAWLSRRQKIILAESRTVTGTLSVLASSIIIYKIFLRYKEQKQSISNGTTANKNITTYHRMLFGISVVDVLTSSWHAVSTLAVPASSGVIFGYGTTATCSAQGFFMQLTTANSAYAAALTTYFMLKIRYNVSEDVFRQRYEFWFHAVPLVFAVGSASTGAALKIFNPIDSLPEFGCWISPFPAGCGIYGGCTRGYKIGVYQDLYLWLFGYGWLFASFAVVFVNSALIYASVRTQERSNAAILAARVRNNANLAARVQSSTAASVSTTIADAALPSGGDSAQVIALPSVGDEETQNDAVDGRDDSSNRTSARKSPSRIAAVQCLLYVFAAFFTGVWIWVPWLGYRLGVSTEWRFFFALMVNIFNPFQGVFNLIIFVRLQYLRLRATEKDWSRLQCFKFCLFSP